MAAERSTGGKVCARRIKATKKQVSLWEWINSEYWLATLAGLIIGAVVIPIAYGAAHLVFWLQHLGGGR